MAHGRRKGSGSWAFRFMVVHMAKKAGDRQKGTKGESQKGEVRRKKRTAQGAC